MGTSDHGTQPKTVPAAVRPDLPTAGHREDPRLLDHRQRQDRRGGQRPQPHEHHPRPDGRERLHARTPRRTLTTKSYYSGPFVIPAEYMTDAKLTAILARGAALTGVRVDKAAARVHGPGLRQGDLLAEGHPGHPERRHRARASTPTPRSPRRRTPTTGRRRASSTPCDDIFVMPHADPTWAIHNNLIPFNDQGGYIWAGCHAASVLENVDSRATPTSTPT